MQNCAISSTTPILVTHEISRFCKRLPTIAQQSKRSCSIYKTDKAKNIIKLVSIQF